MGDLMKKDFYDLKDRFLKTAHQRKHMKGFSKKEWEMMKIAKKEQRNLSHIDNEKDKSFYKGKKKFDKED